VPSVVPESAAEYGLPAWWTQFADRRLIDSVIATAPGLPFLRFALDAQPMEPARMVPVVRIPKEEQILFPAGERGWRHLPVQWPEVSALQPLELAGSVAAVEAVAPLALQQAPWSPGLARSASLVTADWSRPGRLSSRPEVLELEQLVLSEELTSAMEEVATLARVVEFRLQWVCPPAAQAFSLQAKQ